MATDAAPQTTPQAPRSPRRTGRRVALALVGVVLLVVIAAAAFAWWTVRTERGTAWLLARVPGVLVTEPRGRLIGDFQARRVEVLLQRPGATRPPDAPPADRVVLTGLRWRDLALRLPATWRDRPGLHVAALHADRVDVVRADRPATEPARPPATLRLPLQVRIDSLLAAEIHAAPLKGRPLRDVRASLSLGEEAGATHRISEFGVSWREVHVRGDMRIGSDAPFEVEGKLQVTPGASADGTPLAGFDVRATASGPLESLAVTAALRGEAPAAAPDKPPSIDATAKVQPFLAWPLGALDAQMADVDLSTLFAGAPRTLLSGKANVVTAGMSRPAVASVQLTNERAGRTDQQMLPIRSLNVRIEARPDTPDRFELRDLDARLGTDQGGAGRVHGRGQWTRERAELDAEVTDLRPALLHHGAPEMELTGKALLRAEGVVPPGVERREAPLPRFEANARLGGTLRWKGRQQPVELDVDARGTEQAIEVRRASMQTGPSRARIAGQARREGAVWRVRGKASVAAFDPAAWWPGPPDSAWRRRAHRLDGAVDVDLSLAHDFAQRRSPSARAAAVRGRADVVIADSVLAGMRLKGSAKLRTEAGGMAAATAAIDVAGGRLELDGRLDTVGSGGKDRWDLRMERLDLAQLGPLVHLARATGTPPLALAGHADATASVEGRWPAVATRGSATWSEGRVDDMRIARAALRWELGASERSPLTLDAQVTQLSVATPTGSQRLDNARVSISGTAVDHRVTLEARSPVRPPAWIDALQGPPAGRPRAPASGTSVTLHAAGALLLAPAPGANGRPSGAGGAAGAGDAGDAGAAGAGGRGGRGGVGGAAGAGHAGAAGAGSGAATGAASSRARGEARARGARSAGGAGGAGTLIARVEGWKGTLQRLEVRAREAGTPPWLGIAGVALEAAFDRSTRTPRVALSPGRAQLPGAALRWSHVRWQGGAAPSLDVRAELEPIAATPLLARLQPDFGWGGDLMVAGRVDIRSAPTFDAEIVIARERGDLTVTDEGGAPLSLGLTDLRLAMQAKDGLWHFTQALAGKTLGAMAGAVSVRTSPRALWPADGDALSGVLEARVNNLGAWGARVPAGWRLAGMLHASATIGGRFGAPQYVGKVEGSRLGVRNLLQGIDLHDGELAISLQGETARIDRFQARAGDGTVGVEGAIAFGENPRADLTIVAREMLALGRVDRRIVTSGRATLELSADSITLDGRFVVDEGLIDISRSDAPALGDDVVIVDGEDDDAAEAPAGGPARNVSMDVRVDMGERLRLRGRGIDTRLRGDLVITAPGGRLAVNGTVRTEAGSYAAYRQNLRIERGILAFTGPVEDPRLDILAIRPDLDVRVGVAITGTALNPRVRLFSEPAMSDTDKLAWLVLGRASDGLGRTDTALLQSAALALLAGEDGGPGDGLSSRLGLDELSVSQGDGEVRQTIVSLGKQVSRRWYVGYERSLNTTTGTWQLIYRIAQRFTLRGQSGLDNSLDLIWTWRWQ
jgi:translocation and assembly module TamB